MKMTRREVIIRLSLASAALGVLGLKYFPKKSQESFTDFELPQRFEDAGFYITRAKISNSGREVLFMDETFDTNMHRECQVELIDYLIKERGADSIGFSCLYGEPSKNIDEIVDSDFKEFFERPVPIYLHRFSFRRSLFGKYVNQDSVPCYGAEDKDTYLTSKAVEMFDKAVAFSLMFKYYTIIDPQRGRYGQSLVAFVETARARFPNVPFPRHTLKEMTLDTSKLCDKEYGEFKNNLFYARNRSMAENIEHYMTSLGSKRGIVVMRGEHLLPLRPIYTVQELVRYSSSIIDVPMRYI